MHAQRHLDNSKHQSLLSSSFHHSSLFLLNLILGRCSTGSNDHQDDQPDTNYTTVDRSESSCLASDDHTRVMISSLILATAATLRSLTRSFTTHKLPLRNDRRQCSSSSTLRRSCPFSPVWYLSSRYRPNRPDHSRTLWLSLLTTAISSDDWQKGLAGARPGSRPRREWPRAAGLLPQEVSVISSARLDSTRGGRKPRADIIRHRVSLPLPLRPRPPRLQPLVVARPLLPPRPGRPPLQPRPLLPARPLAEARPSMVKPLLRPTGSKRA